MDRELAKYWIHQAKRYEVVNYSNTKDKAVSVNVFSVPGTQVTAVTVTILFNRQKASALPPQDFAMVMKTIEHVIFGLQDTYIDDSDPGKPCFFRPVDMDLKYHNVWKCHRLFFIPESKTAEFYTRLITKQRLSAMENFGIKEVFLKVATRDWDFTLSV